MVGPGGTFHGMTTSSASIVRWLRDSDRDLEGSLRRLIEGGHLPEGQRLPAEREIAKGLRMTRHAVRNALDAATRQGLIEFQSQRIRRVPMRKAQALLSSTVAVVSQLDWTEHPLLMQGTDRAVLLQTIRAAEESDRCVLTIAPNVLMEQGLERIIDPRPTGIVLLGSTPCCVELAPRLQATGVPLVVRSEAGWSRGMDRVYSDHVTGGAVLTQHLLDHGRRRILRVWKRSTKSPPWLLDRDTGHEKVLQEADIQPIPPIWISLVETAAVSEESVALMTGLLLPYVQTDRPIDALMLASDTMARTAASAIRRLGKEPGRDIVIAGYDHLHFDQEMNTVADVLFATVDKRDEAIGRALIETLTQRVAGELGDEPVDRPIRPELITFDP